MLMAVEKGQSTLAKRLNRAPGQIENEAKVNKAEAIKKEQEVKDRKENERKDRDKMIKEIITETNYGGRDQKVKEHYPEMEGKKINAAHYHELQKKIKKDEAMKPQLEKDEQLKEYYAKQKTKVEKNKEEKLQ